MVEDIIVKCGQKRVSTMMIVIYFIPLVSLLPPHHLFTILPPSSLSFSLYSFLPALFLIHVSCAFQHLANRRREVVRMR
jgi:hypothetical protein